MKQQYICIALMVFVGSVHAFNFESVQQKVMEYYCALFSYTYPHEAHDASLQRYSKYKDVAPAKFNYYMRQALIKSAVSMPQEAKQDTLWMAIMYDANMVKYVNHIKKFEACVKSVNEPACKAFLVTAIERLCEESKALQEKQEMYKKRDWLPAI